MRLTKAKRCDQAIATLRDAIDQCRELEDEAFIPVLEDAIKRLQDTHKPPQRGGFVLIRPKSVEVIRVLALLGYPTRRAGFHNFAVREKRTRRRQVA